jgi:hypothetical protein
MIAALAFICIVAAQGVSQLATDQLSDQDRQVAVAALESLKLDTSALLLDSTVPMCAGDAHAFCLRQDSLDRIPPAAWSGDGPSLRKIFSERNRHAIGLGRVDVGIPMIAGAQIREKFMKGPGWSGVVSEFPGVRSLVQISAPVYTADGEQALVYVESVCHGRCGGGYFQLLRRTRGRWLVERTLISWTG